MRESVQKVVGVSEGDVKARMEFSRFIATNLADQIKLADTKAAWTFSVLGLLTAVFTNIYPNHLDEISFDEYKKLKYTLFLSQTPSDFSILNKDFSDLAELSQKLKSHKIFYSHNRIELNTK